MVIVQQCSLLHWYTCSVEWVKIHGIGCAQIYRLSYILMDSLFFCQKNNLSVCHFPGHFTCSCGVKWPLRFIWAKKWSCSNLNVFGSGWSSRHSRNRKPNVWSLILSQIYFMALWKLICWHLMETVKIMKIQWGQIAMKVAQSVTHKTKQ
jgi:hypothetical protein